MKLGRPVDPDRLEVQARKIIDQIRHANKIVGALNRLGHSVDATRSRVNVTELVELVAELYGRRASQAEIRIETTQLTDGLFLTTNPFLLEGLLGACIDAALPRVDASRILAIASEPSSDGTVIRFRHLDGVQDSDVQLGGERSGARAMLAALGGRIFADRHRDEIVFEVRDRERADSGSLQ
jgi:hypothetical protein